MERKVRVSKGKQARNPVLSNQSCVWYFVAIVIPEWMTCRTQLNSHLVLDTGKRLLYPVPTSPFCVSTFDLSCDTWVLKRRKSTFGGKHFHAMFFHWSTQWPWSWNDFVNFSQDGHSGKCSKVLEQWAQKEGIAVGAHPSPWSRGMVGSSVFLGERNREKWGLKLAQLPQASGN